MKIILFLILAICHVVAYAQLNQAQPLRKRFIDKIEIFAGPSLGVNHGNMFVENYRGEYANGNYVENKRLIKIGYSVGLGVYHPIKDWLDVNLRLLYEQRGTKNELNNPLNPVNGDARQITKDEYNYKYFTISLMPVVYVGQKKRFSMSIGVYYSKIQSIRGFIESYNTMDFQKSEGEFNGRYFYHLREDGGMDGIAWMPYLNGIERNDFGIALSAGYKLPIKEKHIISIQLQDSFGIQNINKDNPYGLEEKNHSVILIIDYTFKLQKEGDL